MKILVLYEFRAEWHIVECLELEGIHKGNGFDLAKLSYCYMYFLTLCNTAVRVVCYKVINGKYAEMHIHCFLKRVKS